MSHTPTPWTLKAYSDAYQIFGPENLKVVSTSWHHQTRNPYPLKPEAEANATFIVKAVNSHDRLVEALLLVRSIVVEGAAVGFNPLDGRDWAERLFLSQAATAKALRDAGEGL